MSVTLKRPPKILILPEAKRKLDLYIKLCSSEISGLGKVEVFDRSFLITDVIIFKQEVSASSTELDTEALSHWLSEIVERGGNPAEYRLWWHSHARMGTFWSGTDLSTISLFSDGWMISLVANKSQQYLAQIKISDPISLTIDELPIEVYWAEDEILKQQIKKEIEEKVSQGRFAVGYSGGQISPYWAQRQQEAQEEQESLWPPQTVEPKKGKKNKKKEEVIAEEEIRAEGDLVVGDRVRMGANSFQAGKVGTVIKISYDFNQLGQAFALVETSRNRLEWVLLSTLTKVRING